MSRSQYRNAVLSLVLFLIVLAGALIFWGLFLAPEKKAVVVINLYREPVTVSFAGNIAELDTFDIYSFETFLLGNHALKVEKSEDGELISNNNYSLGRKAQLILSYLSEGDSVQYCHLSADVTGFYYDNLPESDQISKLSMINVDPVTSFSFITGSQIDYMVYPSKYQGKGLPQNLLLGERIIGVYPTDCDLISHEDTIYDVVSSWVAYDPAQQREILNNMIEEILNSPEYSY